MELIPQQAAAIRTIWKRIAMDQNYIAAVADPWEGRQRIKPATKDFSIIVGCYNAAGHLETNISKLARFLDATAREYELLIVDDGSRDDSLAILNRLEKACPRLSVLRNPKNMGKGFSIRNGVLNSRGNHIIFTDTDMAYAESNILSIIEKLESGCPIVVGNRRLPESVYTVNNTLVKYVYRRHRTGTAFNLLVRKLFGLTTRDTQSGLKGFQRHAAMRIFERLYTDGFLFDIEIFIRAKRLGIPIVEIPVHLTYNTDESTVKQIRYFVRLVPELIRIKILDIYGGYSERSPENSRIVM
jgi:glycosyltransferase involved in cell wall biosynthesis